MAADARRHPQPGPAAFGHRDVDDVPFIHHTEVDRFTELPAQLIEERLTDADDVEAGGGGGGEGQQQQGVQVVLDEREMRTVFSNAYRIHTTAEEVVLDFGFNMANPNPQGGAQQLLFRVNDRVVLSYPNVKRLALSLQQLIRQYEQRMGEIPMNPAQPRAQTAR